MLKTGSVYEGQWNDKGSMEGQGVMLWPDAKKYEGNWLRGKANGKGRMIFNNGDYYEGEFQND